MNRDMDEHLFNYNNYCRFTITFCICLCCIVTLFASEYIFCICISDMGAFVLNPFEHIHDIYVQLY